MPLPVNVRPGTRPHAKSVYARYDLTKVHMRPEARAIHRRSEGQVHKCDLCGTAGGGCKKGARVRC